jgi:hypothetical protein
LTAQRQLNLSISQRTVLLTVDALRVHLGVDADTILARIDGGEYRWVFDVSSVKQRRFNSSKHVRELRLWAREIVSPELTSGLTPAEAISEIIGNRPRYYGTEIAQLLLVSRPQIFRLHRQAAGGPCSEHGLPGEIVNGKLWVNRTVLVEFLKRRLEKGAQP